jgi:hypothetical protein
VVVAPDVVGTAVREPSTRVAVEIGGTPSRAILPTVNRRLLALLLVLALGVQGPLVAYASTVADAETVGCGLATGTPASPADAQSHAAPDSCCPGGAPGAGCCFTLCLVSAGATGPTVLVHGYSRAVPPTRPIALAFTSRGDAPLIRPPIP